MWLLIFIIDTVDFVPGVYNIYVFMYVAWFLCSPEVVADAVILLVQDTSKAGAIARVTPRNGVDFHTFDKASLMSLMKPKL